MPKYCHPEFGCDCEEEIRELEAQVEVLRVRLSVAQGIGTALMLAKEQDAALGA